MSFGGFLGIGERYHPLPWAALKYDTGVGGYVVNITAHQLEAGPTFARDEEPWSDPDYWSQSAQSLWAGLRLLETLDSGGAAGFRPLSFHLP